MCNVCNDVSHISQLPPLHGEDGWWPRSIISLQFQQYEWHQSSPWLTFRAVSGNLNAKYVSALTKYRRLGVTMRVWRWWRGHKCLPGPGRQRAGSWCWLLVAGGLTEQLLVTPDIYTKTDGTTPSPRTPPRPSEHRPRPLPLDLNIKLGVNTGNCLTLFLLCFGQKYLCREMTGGKPKILHGEEKTRY